MKTKRIMRLMSMALVAIASLGFFSCSSDDSSDSYCNGHEYVDLGLPSGIKWAACNIGASSPSDYGDYFAWGETTTKDTYTKENYKTWGKELGDISGNPQYDAARANWGGSWRLPTSAECQELQDKCTWTWTSQGGHNGYKVTGPNGNSIFLPAVGHRYSSSLSFEGVNGNYNTSTPGGPGGIDPQGMFALAFDNSGYIAVGWTNCEAGRAVRPVSE